MHAPSKTSNEYFLFSAQVKEFSSFCNRRVQMSWQEAPLDKMLTAMADNDWKHVRNTISPIFSVHRLKRVELQMTQCCDRLLTALNNKAAIEDDIDVRAHMADYSLECIASTVFGQTLNCAAGTEHEFIGHAKAVLGVEAARPLRGLAAVAPTLARVLKRMLRVRYLPKETLNYFTGIIEDAKIVADDPKNQDFLKMMINAHRLDEEDEEEGIDWRRKSESSDLDRVPLSQALDTDEVLAQGLAFLFSGHSTVTDSLTCTLYLLATHADVQEKVVDELTIMTGNAAKVEYETLQELSYLQGVIDESLRLYSPTLRVERVCSKDTVINGLHIPSKTTIVIPIQAIHLDPDLWPDPQTFNPKRFSSEERAKRDPYCWQPFGMGPRSCIGVRLALMQMKMALVHVLSKFKVSPCAATVHPIIRDKVTGSPQDVFLRFQPRD
ncbi:hypothetical protein CAPTEDRAFT_208871 [Capitella teleta]|uniref:Cytochrome P450 n=1 Tax=Capitella teleta TaxID=283909 RepID=R7UPP5_CAPTE|nr:hypothetical protein CAPTEDRAFT_208871 [Capitella teleta]|eukprot:ELU08150.1 hypothetical protein CAPTEDRAFT_208871 [Capitella teleta]